MKRYGNIVTETRIEDVEAQRAQFRKDMRNIIKAIGILALVALTQMLIGHG